MLDYTTLETVAFELIKEHLIFFLIVFSAIIGKIKESSKQNIYTAWIVYFFGTFFHEISHFIFSFISYGKPTWISLLPSINKDDKNNTIGYTLGYVSSKNIRWYNAFFISMAPLSLLPLSFYIYQNFFYYFEENIYTYLLYIFFIISLVFSSIPSKVDFLLLFSNKLLNFIPLILIILVIYFGVHYE